MARLAQRVPDVWVSRSMTTRSPREGEIDGVHYDFLTEEAFMDLVRQDGFLEWARYADHCYGTPLKRIQDMIAAGKQIVLEIDVQGAFQVRDKMPEAHLVFVVPPSLEELERRLRHRNTDSDEKIRERLLQAKRECAEAGKYGYIVVNDDPDRAAKELDAILTAEKCKTADRIKLVTEVLIS